MNFKTEKKNFLNKLDKSKKGSIDKEILQLINKINSKEECYTTSSCSGRIVLLEKKTGKKTDIKWLFKKHSKVNFMEFKKALTNISDYDAWFRFEPAILHIACKKIEDAQNLVDKARSLGFRRSGIQATKRKIIIEISSSDILETVIAKNKNLLIADDYLKILIYEANKKLEKNRQNIEKLYNIL